MSGQAVDLLFTDEGTQAWSWHKPASYRGVGTGAQGSRFVQATQKLDSRSPHAWPELLCYCHLQGKLCVLKQLRSTILFRPAHCPVQRRESGL